eukprot:s1439_g2.t1
MDFRKWPSTLRETATATLPAPAPAVLRRAPRVPQGTAMRMAWRHEVLHGNWASAWTLGDVTTAGLTMEVSSLDSVAPKLDLWIPRDLAPPTMTGGPLYNRKAFPWTPQQATPKAPQKAGI